MKKFVLIFSLFLHGLFVFGQDSASVAANKMHPKVTMVRIVHATDEQKASAIAELKGMGSQKPIVAYPNSIIRFTIKNPMEFLNRRPTDQSRVVIYVNGLQLKGMATSWYSSVSGDKIKAAGSKIAKSDTTADIDIVLGRTDSTKKAWDFFYANTGNFYDNYVDVDASIGWEGMSALQKDSTKKVPLLRIVYFSSVKFDLWLAFFVLVVSGFIFLAVKTNAIKDGDRECAYSLSLTQLLFWTTLVIGGFIYSLVLTDLTSSFNPTILYMLGISLTTTGVAGTIDSGAKKYSGNRVVKKHSGNFFKDVLTGDGENYSVQRIQVFAWNLVLGLYFIFYTIGNKTMPEFSTTLLALAGFSSASYLTGKTPENNSMENKSLEKEKIENERGMANQPGDEGNAIQQAADQSAANKTASDQAAVQPTAEQPATAQPTSDQVVPQQPVVQPTAIEPASDTPAPNQSGTAQLSTNQPIAVG